MSVPREFSNALVKIRLEEGPREVQEKKRGTKKREYAEPDDWFAAHKAVHLTVSFFTWIAQIYFRKKQEKTWNEKRF